MSASVGFSGTQPSSARASSDDATSAAGSPSRRGAISTGSGAPVTSRATSTTCRLEKPVPARGIGLNSPWDVLLVGDDLYIAMAGHHQIWVMNLGRKDIVPNINWFMRVPVTTEGGAAIALGVSPPGCQVALRAEMDALAVISNCPQVNNPCNGFKPTPIKVEITG